MTIPSANEAKITNLKTKVRGIIAQIDRTTEDLVAVKEAKEQFIAEAQMEADALDDQLASVITTGRRQKLDYAQLSHQVICVMNVKQHRQMMLKALEASERSLQRREKCLFEERSKLDSEITRMKGEDMHELSMRGIQSANFEDS